MCYFSAYLHLLDLWPHCDLKLKKSRQESTPILFVIVSEIILDWGQALTKIPSGIFVGIRGGRQ